MISLPKQSRLLVFILVSCVLCNGHRLIGQNEILLDTFQRVPWKELKTQMESAHLVHFYLDEKEMAGFNPDLTNKKNSFPLFSFLSAELPPYGFYPVALGPKTILISKNPGFFSRLPQNFFQQKDTVQVVERPSDQATQTTFIRTREDYLGQAIVVGEKALGAKESIATVSGILKTVHSGEPVIGATLYLEELKMGTSSDEAGFFTLQVKKGTYTVSVNSLNHETKKFEIEVLSSGKLDIPMEEKLFTLSGVVVTSERFHNVRSNQMGFEKLAVKNVKEIPTVLGEGDIIKVAQLLPGIQSVGEGAPGFNVRGSPADQNLFYLDQIPIYNTSHLLGFFSVFNSDAVREFSIFKGNIPANFGGRLSSIFDVQARQGNQNQFTAKGGISPITARLLVEGPIQKGKSSYLASVRSTYSDWMLQLVQDPDIKKSQANFADGLINLAFDLSQTDQIRVLAYYSHDKINYASRNDFNYQNSGASVSWRRVLDQRHTLGLNYVFYTYGSEVRDNEIPAASYFQKNDLIHQEFKGEITLRPGNNHDITVGANSIFYNLNRGNIQPNGPLSLQIPLALGREKGIESGLFLQEEWRASARFSLQAGLRYNNFNALGGQPIYTYAPGQPKERETILDTLQIESSEIARTYHGLDWRGSVKYLISPHFSVKGSVNRLHQYIFLLSNTIALSPTDKWKLVDYNIEPMIGDQASLGVYSNLFRNKLEISLEGYVKRVQNLVEYRDGANLIISEVPEWDVLQGELEAYGLELMLKKPAGRLNGWMNYTFASTRVTVTNPNPDLRINFGNSYPSNFDKPHAFNLVANYKFTRRFSLSSNVVYSTGRPITYPAGSYYLDDIRSLHYSQRNEFRIPDYFRIDFSAKLEGNLSSTKKLHGTWILSIYNLVGRKNAYSVFFLSEADLVKGYKLSVFGAPIVSLAYNFKLGSYEE